MSVRIIEGSDNWDSDNRGSTVLQMYRYSVYMHYCFYMVSNYVTMCTHGKRITKIQHTNPYI